eukprot:scaffold159979_cov64-Attheya_sp.AAC.1
METLGRTTGYLFMNMKTERRALSARKLIEPECEIEEEFGMQRSFRRGFDTECRNRGIKEADINSMCRWQ